MPSSIHPILRILFFRSLAPLRREEKSGQILGRGMGSAHALKGIHTRRNRVCCHKISNFSKLPVYKCLKNGGAPVGDVFQKSNNVRKLLNFSVYKICMESPS